MFQELMSLFRSHDPVAAMASGFEEMVELTTDMVLQAGQHLLDPDAPTLDPRAFEDEDKAVNKLERRIRKQVIAHLTLAEEARNAPYGLLLMSVVKDLERVGDYAKNIVGIESDGGAPVPPFGDPRADELRAIRTGVEAMAVRVGKTFTESDAEGASELIRQGKELSQRADRLIPLLAQATYDGATMLTLVLAVRYYKRIASHLTNVLTGVVMPLHKLDYFDEKALTA